MRVWSYKPRDITSSAMASLPTLHAMIRGYGLLTGWGPGVGNVPAVAREAAAGRRLVPLATPTGNSERLRRATRQCLLANAVVAQALDVMQMPPSMLAGPRTAVVFASASSYAAANWTFLTGDTENALHFPYTAPSAVPGEVTIQYGITGPYLILLSGANAGLEALWQAALLLDTRQCDRALVLGVETFAECADLYAAGRWLLGTPLVETAACLLLERHEALTKVCYRAETGEAGVMLAETLLQGQTVSAVYLCLPTLREERRVAAHLQARWPHLAYIGLRTRLGVCLACTPLIALMLASTEGKAGDALLLSRWWDTWTVLRWPMGSF